MGSRLCTFAAFQSGPDGSIGTAQRNTARSMPAVSSRRGSAAVLASCCVGDSAEQQLTEKTLRAWPCGRRYGGAGLSPGRPGRAYASSIPA